MVSTSGLQCACFGLFHLVAVLGVLSPATQTKADEKARPAERVAVLKAEIADIEQALLNASDDDPEVEKLREAYKTKQLATIDEFLEIAKADPASPAAFAALDWRLRNPRSQHRGSFSTVLSLLIEHHAANPEIAKGLSILSYVCPERLPEEPNDGLVSKLFQAVIEKNPDQIARGHAALGQAKLARRAFAIANRKDSPDARTLGAIAEGQFEAVIREYGDCTNLGFLGDRVRAPTLRGEAEVELFELRRLKVGQIAPEIEGDDLDGMKVRLSDYRGKVTLLVFWASWCGACMKDVPHEKELCKRFEGRPFAIVGLNGDDSREDAQATVKKHSIPWRSFWNGERGADGPIAVAWNVRSWPEIYVIDHKGIICHKNVRDDQLDKWLEELVVAAEVANKSKE